MNMQTERKGKMEVRKEVRGQARFGVYQFFTPVLAVLFNNIIIGELSTHLLVTAWTVSYKC